MIPQIACSALNFVYAVCRCTRVYVYVNEDLNVLCVCTNLNVENCVNDFLEIIIIPDT